MNLGVQGSTASGSPGHFTSGEITPLPAADFADRPSLRTVLRERRRALSWRTQQRAAMQLQRVLLAHPQVNAARRVAAYLASDGELDPQPTVAALRASGKQILLPVLDRLQPGHLRFSLVDEASAMRPNRFGIPEPYPVQPCAAWSLDLILLPLVGFDRSGGRLGMGGGFYDRTLSRIICSALRRPVLIGLAHGCQEVDRLPVAEWDIPLDWIVTPDGWIRCRS